MLLVKKKEPGSAASLVERLSSGRAILIVCLLASLAYANSLGGDFVFDDDEQIVENRDIRSWDNLGKAFVTHVWAFREKPEALRVPVPPPYYRPIFTVVLTLGFKLFGLHQQGWHLLCLLLHIIVSIEVYLLIFLIASRKFEALIAAALFAVYPIHVESVSWISGMTDPLFAAFYLPAFYLYIKFRRGGRKTDLVLSLGLFALAAFSKETGLSLILLLLVYEAIEMRFSSKQYGRGPGSAVGGLLTRSKWITAYCAVAAGYLTARYLVLGGFTWYNPHAHQGPFADTLITLPSIVWTYLLHLIWPVGLSIAYQTTYITSLASVKFWIPAAGLLLIAILISLFRKRLGLHVWLALALMLVPLLPVLDLRQLSEEYLVFDRYLYLTIAGWGYLIAIAVARFSEGRFASPALRLRITASATIALVAALTAATAVENRNWLDSYSLWSNAAKVRPGFWAAHYNAGLALMDLKRPEEALNVLLTAARLAPDEPSVFDALGRTYDQLGDRPGAVDSFHRALRIDPLFFESLNNLGTIYFKSGDMRSAEQYFLAALKLRPQATAARFNLAMSYANQRRYPESVRELERVAEMAPADAEARYELGVAYERSGRIADAVQSFRRALEISVSEELTEKAREGLSRLDKSSRF